MQKSKGEKRSAKVSPKSKVRSTVRKNFTPKSPSGSQPPSEKPLIEVRIPPAPQLVYDSKTETLHHGNYKEAAKLSFLVALAHYRGIISPACRAANISRKTIHDWTEADPLFAEAVQVVRLEVGEELEEAAYRKAIDHLDGGMLRFMLAANFPRYKNIDKGVPPLPDDEKPEDKNQMAALLTTKLPDGRTVAEGLRDTYRGSAQ